MLDELDELAVDQVPVGVGVAEASAAVRSPGAVVLEEQAYVGQREVHARCRTAGVGLGVLRPVGELKETRIAAQPPVVRSVGRPAGLRHGLQPVELVAQAVVHVHPALDGGEAFVLDHHKTSGGLVVVDQVAAQPSLNGSGVDVGDFDVPPFVFEDVDVAAEVRAVPGPEEPRAGHGMGGIVLDQTLFGGFGNQPGEVGVVGTRGPEPCAERGERKLADGERKTRGVVLLLPGAVLDAGTVEGGLIRDAGQTVEKLGEPRSETAQRGDEALTELVGEYGDFAGEHGGEVCGVLPGQRCCHCGQLHRRGTAPQRFHPDQGVPGGDLSALGVFHHAEPAQLVGGAGGA
ncbi:hypothetical protein OG978_30895 [Streptomyces sp. NBC_01591]|uniref:hypothetical protein n=1 Tax=Streptomyces sp. NBC_01591 TaxID=2975888 RepID=UPI002DD80831|nr:hypothetical protein [Streptomyces sp. NBC_01591]WSD71406.1 hypothetical protein OG978_30895 [Streptomyces sp. NBC_01591]